MGTLWRSKIHSSHRHFLFALILAALLLLFLPRSSHPDGNQSEFFSDSRQQSANIDVIPLERKVLVHVINKEKKRGLPKAIGITLRSAKGEQYDLELAAIEGAQYGYYGGLIPQQQDSFMAVELRIPFGKKVVRLEPPVK